MTISSKMIFLLTALIVAGIVAHQWYLRRSPDHSPMAVPSVSSVEPAVSADSDTLAFNESAPTVHEAAQQSIVEVPAEASTVGPFDDPVERRRLVNEQARLMYEYASKAGPDDPFSLTTEQIEAFRRQGDPTLW